VTVVAIATGFGRSDDATKPVQVTDV
jgi:hypothetical protein